METSGYTSTPDSVVHFLQLTGEPFLAREEELKGHRATKAQAAEREIGRNWCPGRLLPMTCYPRLHDRQESLSFSPGRG